MNKKLDLVSAIRLKEELTELVKTYGLDNVKSMLVQIPEQKEELKEEKKVEEKKPLKPLTPPLPPKPEYHLPPNIHNVEEFEIVVNNFATKGKIKPEVLQSIKVFIQNSKLIMSGQYKKIDESFIINLTSKPDTIQVLSPEEDWVRYNGEIIRKQLKHKLRPVGYDFMDSEVEVGKIFDNERHNIVSKENVAESALDNRVLKVLNEGLIIEKKLHINANVVIGSFRPNSY
ncbi:MAG: hypothetical protein WC536_04385 [Patescibacteria group bacterium]